MKLPHLMNTHYLGARASSKYVISTNNKSLHKYIDKQNIWTKTNTINSWCVYIYIHLKE